MTKINIARDFSLFPGGRYRTDGEHSGEEFRDEYLIPALAKNEQVQIELDGTRGYGSSFLEETFGGLVRIGHAPEDLLKMIVLVSRKPALVEEIQDYINAAALN